MVKSSRAQKRGDGELEPTPYDDLLCFNFYRGWRIVQDFYAPAFPKELNPQRSYVLEYCIEQERTVSEIATMMQIDDAAISNMLRRMEKDGLIEKRKSKSDGRALKVKTTEHGAKLVREIVAKFHEIDKSIKQEITDEDRAFLHKIIKILHKHTKEQNEDLT